MLNRNAVLNLQQPDESEHGASVHQYNLRDMEKGIMVSKATVWEQLELTKCTRRYFTHFPKLFTFLQGYDDDIKCTQLQEN
jgi:hypothetical protein